MQLGNSFAIVTFMNMLMSIIFIGIAWWGLQVVRFDLFVRDSKGSQAKLLQILLSIVIGHGVARFFVDYIQWTNIFSSLFHF